MRAKKTFDWVVTNLKNFPIDETQETQKIDLKIPGTMDEVEITFEFRGPVGEVAPLPFDVLLYSCSGQAAVEIDSDTVALSAKDFIFIAKDTPYRWQTPSRVQWCVIVCKALGQKETK